MLEGLSRELALLKKYLSWPISSSFLSAAGVIGQCLSRSSLSFSSIVYRQQPLQTWEEPTREKTHLSLIFFRTCIVRRPLSLSLLHSSHTSLLFPIEVVSELMPHCPPFFPLLFNVLTHSQASWTEMMMFGEIIIKGERTRGKMMEGRKIEWEVGEEMCVCANISSN